MYLERSFWTWFECWGVLFFYVFGFWLKLGRLLREIRTGRIRDVFYVGFCMFGVSLVRSGRVVGVEVGFGVKGFLKVWIRMFILGFSIGIWMEYVG